MARSNSAARGFNLDGVHRLTDAQDTRTFYAYVSPEERVDTRPAAHFLRIGQPMPKELVGYQHSTLQQDSRSAPGPLAVRIKDLPGWIARCRGVHLSPGDYLTHILLPTHLHEQGVPTLSLDPSLMYMDPAFRRDLPSIVKGLDAFLPSEMEARGVLPAQPAVRMGDGGSLCRDGLSGGGDQVRSARSGGAGWDIRPALDRIGLSGTGQ